MESLNTSESCHVPPEPCHMPPPQPYFLPVQVLLEEELKMCDNPHLTYETLVLRLVKRLLSQLQLPWSHVLETVRQGPCVLDKDMHARLQRIWNRRKRQVTLDEQHCVERILGHDHNRIGDMMKLAGIVNKIADPVDLFHFYAMDGFSGDDPKKYMNAFRHGPEDLQFRHFEAVRELYDKGLVENPTAMREFLETIFQQEREVDDGMQTARDLYLYEVGGWQVVKEIAEWRWEQEEKMKKKRSSEDERASNKMLKTEDERE